MNQPLVIDFELRTDGFWIIVQNTGDTAIISFTAQFVDMINALPVSILGMPIRGNPAGARTVVSAYDLFTNCTYMAPGKRFELFVENDRVFYEINPAEFKIIIKATDANNQETQYSITHNLKIYQQLLHPYIIQQKK